MATVQNREREAMEEKQKELESKVDMATVEKIRHQFEQDLKTLRERCPGQVQPAKEAALDAQYLAQRQSKLVQDGVRLFQVSFWVLSMEVKQRLKPAKPCPYM